MLGVPEVLAPVALERAFLPPGVFPASMVARTRTTWEGVSTSLLGAVPRVGVDPPLGARDRFCTLGRVDPPVPGLADIRAAPRLREIGVAWSGVRGSGPRVDPPPLRGVPTGDSAAFGAPPAFVGVSCFFPLFAEPLLGPAPLVRRTAGLVGDWALLPPAAPAFLLPAALALAGAFFVTAFFGARDALARGAEALVPPLPAALRGRG